MAAENFKDVLSRLTRDQGKKRMPLSLKLDVPGVGEVSCADLLRVVPSRRVTCMGSAGGKQLIIKLFFARFKAHRNWKRSDYGCRCFLEKNIPAPAILYSGYLPRQGIYAMVFEYLNGAVGLRDCMEQTLDPSAKTGLLDALMAVVASQHQAGIIQHDLHMGNFMIVDGIMYSLDGDHVSSLHRPAGRSGSLRNLAYLFAQDLFLFGNGIDELAQAYGKQRGWPVSGRDVEEIKGYISETRTRMFMKYRWKIVRKESRFVEHSKGMETPLDAGPDDGRVLTQVLDRPAPKPYGNGCNDGGFTLVPTSRGRVPVRKCTAYGPALLRWFWKSDRVWRSMGLLKMLGLNTAVPVVITGEKKGFWKWDCSIFFQPVAGPTIREMFLSGSFPEGERVRAVSALSDTLCSLRDAGIVLVGMHPGEMVFDQGKVIFLSAEKVQRLKGNRFSLMIMGFLRQLDEMPGSRAMFQEQLKKRDLI
jgi:hypothetical protein